MCIQLHGKKYVATNICIYIHIIYIYNIYYIKLETIASRGRVSVEIIQSFVSHS